MEKELEDDYIEVEQERNTIVVQPTETAAVQAQTQAQTQPQTQAPQKISADRAKSIAFGHAGVSAGQVRELSVEYDDDHGGVYEIDFKVGDVEYDYEIAASNGAVRKANAERDD